MKKNSILIVVSLIVITAVFAAANIWLDSAEKTQGRPYMVEINRLCKQIENEQTPDISQCEYVTSVTEQSQSSDFFNSKSDNYIKQINGKLYRFDYSGSTGDLGKARLILNISLGALSILLIAVLVYFRLRLLRPFNKLSNVPYDLSKGKLTQPLDESKNRYFGKFVWGVNMLRENIIDQKEQELELLKEKQTLILSISHDIKTPLSAIKLYSKAMTKGIYTDKEKLAEAARNIDRNADDIERFVTQLTHSANEDFLHLEVEEGEFYLSELLESVKEHYAQRLHECGTLFTVDNPLDCILKGDLRRSIEVMRNLMENALKYGDGKYINICVTQEDNCKLVCVANSGCTLPQGEMLHIFDSFWRGSNSADKSGSGLGLYICRQLMLKMNGEIFAEQKDGEMHVTVVFPKA